MKRTLKKAIVLGALWSFGGTAMAGEKAVAVEPAVETVTVRVYQYARVQADALERAQQTAERIFAHTGVALHWVACPTNEVEGKNEKYAECMKPLGRQDLFLRIMPCAPARFARQKGVSGAAMLPENGGPGRYVLVFYDRVERMTWERLNGSTQGVFAYQLPHTVYTSVTLGMVIAHELGHLLLGANSHSKRGIMQATWDRRDLEDSYLGRQRFTGAQWERIQKNIQARVAVGQMALARR